jgi:hypothetical protein
MCSIFIGVFSMKVLKLGRIADLAARRPMLGSKRLNINAIK